MFSAATKDSGNATINDAKTTAYSAKRDLRNVTDETTGDLSVIAERAGRKVRGFVDNANAQLTDATDKVTEEIRSNPLRSSLIALGAGFILGAIFRR